MGAYSAVARHLYYPLLDRYKRAPYHRALREAEQNQHRSRDELAELQLAKLRKILAHAETTCPYYREQFAAHGVSAANVREIGDLRRFPLIGKPEVMANRERMISARYPGKLFAGATSGSTGLSMRFHLDSGQYAWSEACQWRGRRWWGVDRGNRQLVLWSRPVDPGLKTQLASRLKTTLRNLSFCNTSNDFGDAKVDEVIRTLRRERPPFIYGYGSNIAKLAARLDERRETLDQRERPRLVVYTADHLWDSEREVAARVFGAPVISDYGAGECGGIAEECEHGTQHISIDHVLVEVLRPDWTPADPDETGEIVLTTLNNRGMPLIRYRVGDMGSLGPRDAGCSCGVTLPSMRLQIGRVNDLVTTSTTRNVSSHLFSNIQKQLSKNGALGIRQFLVEQTADDRFSFWVVLDSPERTQPVDQYIEYMRRYLGTQIEVAVRLVDDIPSGPSGKRSFFRKSFAGTY
jgi:phenylacetate-CoA ligase